MAIDYNNDATWATDEIYRQPDFDLASYQARVDKICGKAANGQSNMIVFWSPSPQGYKKRYCEWDKAGFGTKTHLRAKYCYFPYDDGEIAVDIPVPRWVIEQHQDPAQYLATDELTRWKTEDNGKQKSQKELRPRYPTDGIYLPFLVIGKHNGWCCKALKNDSLVCYGDYRVPDESYLALLKQAVVMRDANETQRTDQPISRQTLRQAAREAASRVQKEQEETRAMRETLLDEHLPEILEMMTGEKFRDLPAWSLPTQKTESGLVTLN
jgi:hypothetical protein